jgi:isoaspartyl peptidase/L-asparaginase-like protein (Ntn-hydrolase superfamily)
MMTFRIIIHGGAGVISKENTEAPRRWRAL